MKFTNTISEDIWKDRYRKDNESVDDNIKRVAKFCSNNEQEYEQFYNIMDKGLFFPAGRPMSNAYEGTKLGLNNCFVHPNIEDDLSSIFDAVKDGALVQQSGGGIGYDFSMLRPTGTLTSKGAIASGPISFMNVFNTQTSTIVSKNRRGANMGVISVRHPDIFDFISSKSKDSNTLNFFNISVMVDDDFMNAVNENKNFNLHWPIYDKKYNIIKDESKWKIKKTIKARDLWNDIIKNAYDTGEPGILFYDTMNKDNNTWYTETITATNPCGEYIAGSLYNQELPNNQYGGACNLGSLYLHKFVKNEFTDNAYFDFDLLKNTIGTAVRFLDNIIDKNNYPLKIFENYQKNMRTIGLGITGLGDMLTMMNMRYSSDKSLDFVNNLMNFISYNAYKTSIELSKEKGSFNFLDKEKFIQSGYIQKQIKNSSDWKSLADDIKQFGIRNARMIVIAPSGTMSLTFGNNCSQGIEPIFSLEYDRRVKIGGQGDENVKIVKFSDYSYELCKKEEHIINPQVFVTALELPVEDHIKMLKTISFYVDSSISKTINVPEDYPFEKTKDIYNTCWESGIKGCTIFRPNSIRQGILIDPNKKEKNTDFEYDTIEPLSKEIIGRTYGSNVKKYTSCGRLYINFCRDKEGNLAECFINTGKGGVCHSNVNAISRLISLALRSGIKVSEISDQLRGIECKACSASIARGNKLDGISCPDIIGKTMDEEYNSDEFIIPKPKKKAVKKKQTEQKTNETITNSKCPECGGDLIHNGGCVDCMNCGYSHCG